MFTLKLGRSGGVPVTIPVRQIIARGNRARDRREWETSAAAYTEVLRLDPGLAHIWIQLGHALKERGLHKDAKAAYRRATELLPNDPDGFLHLGYMANEAGEHRMAGRHFVAAFRANPAHADAATALHQAIVHARGKTRDQLIDLARDILGQAKGASEPEVDHRSGDDRAETLVFDASDLIGYFLNARLPTGIQRVQIETITQAVRSPGSPVYICCFVEGREDWVEISTAHFLTLTALSVAGGDRRDPNWITALNDLNLRLILANPLVFPHGATLVNLGTSWRQNYLLFVRDAKFRYGIRYVPFVHDLIPIVAPQYCTKPLVRDFVSWAVGVFTHADGYLVNSEATRRDLMRVAATLGHVVDEADIAVIRLDGDFRKPDALLRTVPEKQASADRGKAGGRATTMVERPPEPPRTDKALVRWGLDDRPFVLFVATVEPRKGHVVALDAWLALIGRVGAQAVPRLVCVGNKGWMNDAVYARLERSDILATRVTMLSGVSDAELALLYQKCLFTIYPSFYEGWGLPITESFCYGKPVITSNSSSLPEAGGSFAVYVPAGDVQALAAAVERMAFDQPYREGIADRIRAGARARSWGDIAEQIRTELTRLSSRRPGEIVVPPQPVARYGVFHSLSRGTAATIWPGAATAETFRVGVGWRSPELDGSWTRSKGAELAIGLPQGGAALRLGFLLLGSHDEDVDWRLHLQGGTKLSGTLSRSGRKWVTFTHVTPPAVDLQHAPQNEILCVRLRAEPTDLDPAQPDEHDATVGLAGFFLYPEADTATGMKLLEAIALGNLDDLDAFRQPDRSDVSKDLWTD